MRHQRTLFITLLIAALAMTIYLVLDFRNYGQQRDEHSIALGQQAGLRVAEALDSRLQKIVSRAGVYAVEVATISEEAALLPSLQAESERFPMVMGVMAAFEAKAFQGRELYAPFYNKHRGEFEFIEDDYDYTARGLETTNWYTSVIESGEANWSEPYFDQEAGTLVVDYAVPLRNAQGATLGIVGYTIALNDLTLVVDALSVGESGYGFTFDTRGTILSHPHPDYLLDNVFQQTDGKDAAIIAKLRDETQGVVTYDSTYTFKYSWFFFSELPSTGWKSVLVFAADDLLGASDEGRRKLIHIAMAASLVLFALMLLLLRVDNVSPRKLWQMVIGTSAIIVGNIVLIWQLNLSTDFSLLGHERERIVNHSILQKYVQGFDDDLYRLEGEYYEKIPTGVFIETYEIDSFQASLIGKLWMKYPKSLYHTTPPGFYLPDVSAIESRGLNQELISEIEYDEYILVTWRFRVTLEQDFNYQQYPFEQNTIRLLIQYPDFSKNIILVPDLDSYEILNPSVKPGLNRNISVPSSETISSFFSFQVVENQTTFGNGELARNHPALLFSMVAKRIWLSPFIANIIPILIVALIMFIVLLVSSKKHDERAGLTTMNVIQSSAGFLFILLLAHVNERNRIETPEIAYIELFYFSMYVFITLQSVTLAMLFRGSNWKIFAYEDNLVLKLLFWPVLLSIWLTFTLLRFY